MKNVLICDDESDIRDVLTMILEIEFGEQVVVTHAEDGSVGVEMLKEKNEFDLIICDMNMPNQKGVAVYNYNESNKKIPFILLSADCHEDTKLFNGFNDNETNSTMTKPWKENEFLDKVNLIFFQTKAG